VPANLPAEARAKWLKLIHSSLYENFKYAVVWRREAYPKWPKRVGLEYRLKDGDVVEIHA